MRRGAMLMDLAQQVRRDTEALPAQYHPDVMLAHLNEVESALDRFTILARVRMDEMFSVIQRTGWQSLAMLAAILSTHRPEQVVDEETVHDLAEQVRDLIDKVTDDDHLDADLKRYILARLFDVEGALTNAYIGGIADVELAANSLLGAAHC